MLCTKSQKMNQFPATAHVNDVVKLIQLNKTQLQKTTPFATYTTPNPKTTPTQNQKTQPKPTSQARNFHQFHCPFPSKKKAKN